MFTLLLNIKSASASLTPSFTDFSTTSQVPFFKSPESLFPSGHTTLENLQKLQINQTLTFEKMIKWNNKLFKADDLKPVLPLHLSQSVLVKKTKKRWWVLEARVLTLDVQDFEKTKTEKFKIEELTADPFDLGFALTLKDVYLRDTSDTSAKVLTTVPQAYKFKVIRYENSFAKVSYRDYVGYISLSEMVTKFDLATMIFTDQRWQFVKKREFDFMITNDNKKIHLNEITGLLTPETRGVIASANQKIPLWSQVEVVNSQHPNWLQSKLKGHGPVWWRPSTTEISQKESILTIDELIRRKISSVSFHPKNPSKAILSANGVFITENGLHWQRLKQFDDFNGPVHYFNDLLIFVGNFRSVDGGKKFENYIQIDKLATAIEDQYGFLPKRLQVTRIETKPPFRLKIEIETGLRKIKMESPLFTQDWKAIKI